MAMSNETALSETAGIFKKRQRKFAGRSSRGCQNCRSKHIKCDENVPQCMNCMKSRLDCNGPRVRIILEGSSRAVVPSLALASNPDWNQLENRYFNRFANEVAPLLGGRIDRPFWNRLLLSSARSEDAILTAILAIDTFSRIGSSSLALLKQKPTMDTAPRDYKKGLEWYVRSIHGLRRSLESKADLNLMLLTAVCYISAEQQLGNNTDSMVKSAFAYVHKYKYTMSKQDSNLLASMIQILRLATAGASDTSIIPREHKSSVITHILSIAAKTGEITEALLSRLQISALIFDLEDIIAHDDETLAANFDSRMLNCLAHLRVQNKMSRDPCTEGDIIYYQVQWQVYQSGMPISRNLIEDGLFNLLEPINGMIRWAISSGLEDPLPLVDWNIIVPCLFIAWYAREELTLTRLRECLGKCPSQKALVQKALSYIEILVYTDYDRATKMELRLFGSKPKVFKRWHAFRCVAEISYLTGLSMPLD